mmetsp:Transcript_33376/g.61525  ORF Transcript_33376/g.61525 Transcript_33376/m.61525 type:complete len:207 (+) Transcript_33376:1184-1804(+)
MSRLDSLMQPTRRSRSIAKLGDSDRGWSSPPASTYTKGADDKTVIWLRSPEDRGLALAARPPSRCIISPMLGRLPGFKDRHSTMRRAKSPHTDPSQSPALISASCCRSLFSIPSALYRSNMSTSSPFKQLFCSVPVKISARTTPRENTSLALEYRPILLANIGQMYPGVPLTPFPVALSMTVMVMAPLLSPSGIILLTPQSMSSAV